MTTNDKLPKDSLSIVTKNKVVKNNVSCFTKELVNKRRAVPQSKLKKVVSLDEIDNLFDKYIKSVSDYANLYESVGKTLSKLYLQYQSEDNFKLFFENEKIGSNLNELGKNEIKKLYQIWNKDYSHKTNDELLMTTANKLNLFLMHHYIPKDDKERNEIIQLINNLENSQNINLSEKINSKRIFEGLKLLEDKKYYQRWPDRNHLLIRLGT
ncbi:hypothetical protein [Spiroplasma endosymbiont of Tipula paludosa]|uniref:hypothetical protein n=1 Tax=Spiroplasma endosymbiont of Tipula paludosa TaxID=3066295 RepID=UPI0035C8CE95